jgi:hypothetical protein
VLASLIYCMKKKILLICLPLILVLGAVFLYTKASQNAYTPLPESEAFNALCQQHFGVLAQDSLATDSLLLAKLPQLFSELKAQLGALPKVDSSKLQLMAYYDLGMGRFQAFQQGETRIVTERELPPQAQHSFKKDPVCLVDPERKHGSSRLIRDRLYLTAFETH